MKQIPLTKWCVIALALAAVPAFAGPMPMDKNVAPSTAACTWTGFYVGANAGVAEFQSRFSDLNSYGNYPSETENTNYATMTYEVPAFTGGGQVGYNYQIGELVLGIEADFSGLGSAINHNRIDQGEDSGHENLGIDTKGKIDFMSTLRVKLGISFNENRAMIYMTGGGAYAHGDWDTYAFYYPETYGSTYSSDWRGEAWRWGWTGGVGFEYALNCHWSLKAEALYTWLNQDTQGISGPSDSVWIDYTNKYRFEDDLWTYRVGINYKFTGFFGGH